MARNVAVQIPPDLEPQSSLQGPVCEDCPEDQGVAQEGEGQDGGEGHRPHHLAARPARDHPRAWILGQGSQIRDPRSQVLDGGEAA